MAKKKELTPEEKLQQALVPKEEQPYPLPEGWKWVRLGDITKIVGGGTPSSSVKEYYEDGNIAWISPSDLSNYSEKYISYGAKNITKLGLEKSSAQLMPKGTVLLSSRAPIGYVAIAKIALSTNQGFKNFLPSPSYLPDYLYWYLKGNTEILKRYASGTTFLELSAKKAALIKFPLAPIKEQKRIVQTIEKYFCRLDKIQEILKSILCDSGKRKSAILHKAFTGELTVKWREENKISFETWRVVSFNEVAARYSEGPEKEEGGDLIIGLNHGSDIYALHFANIKDINFALRSIIDRGLEGTSQEEVEQLVGQLKFLRAWNYFQLVRMWGGMQILTEDDTGDYFIQLPKRSSVEETYAFIIQDFEEAIDKLPEDWGTFVRPNKWVAKALLAKAYLTMATAPLNDASYYSKAASLAKEVIDSLLPESV